MKRIDKIAITGISLAAMLMVQGCGRGKDGKVKYVDPTAMVFVKGGALPDIGNGPITVDSFLIGKYEVTWGIWKAVKEEAPARGYEIGNRDYGFTDGHPVHNVSWHDVVKWCNLRSEIEGLMPVYTVGGSVYKTGEQDNVDVNASANGYRLPTSDEWEFAARGGTRSRDYTYSGSNDANEVAWHWGNADGPAPVGQKAPNELGIHDMSGNLWEWCFDWDPDGVGLYRIYRGGSWYDFAYISWVAYGFSIHPDIDSMIIGFRVVLPAQ